MEKSCEKPEEQEPKLENSSEEEGIEEEESTEVQEQETKDETPDSGEVGTEEPVLTQPSGNIDEIVHRFEEAVGARCSEILEAFQEKLAYDRFKEEQVRQLHSELQSYKSDLVAKAMRPLVAGMIRLHEDMGRMVDFFQESEDDKLERERVLKNFAGLREDIIEVLDQSGIVAYNDSGPGQEFNPRRQRLLKKVPASDPDLVGKVVESLRYGFDHGDTNVQKEAVSVYAQAEQEPPEPVSKESETAPSEGEQ